MSTAWLTKYLGDIYDVRDGTHDSPKFQDEGFPLITSKNLKCGELNFEKVKYISKSDYDAINKRSAVHRGDLLFAMIGTIGNPIVVAAEPNFAIKNVALFKVPSSQDSYFLKYYLDSNFVKTKMASEAKGTTHKFVGLGYLRKFPIPLPPLPEQKRIVAILDEAFAGIDAAVANTEKNLANARELFESYLNSAFTRKGDGWVETTVGGLVLQKVIDKPIDGNHGEIHPKKADFVTSGVPFIMASDLVEGRIDQENCNFISRGQGDSLRKGFAKNGDVLLSHKGTIGRVAVLNTDHDYVMLTPQVTYYRVLNKELLYNRYLYYFFQSPKFQNEMGDIAGAGSTRAYIGITKQNELAISYPSLEEQRLLVKRLDTLVPETQHLETIYQQKLTALTELKQSILQKAFAGEL